MNYSSYGYRNFLVFRKLSYSSRTEFHFSPFGDRFGSSTNAEAGKIEKLQIRAVRVWTSACYDTSTDFLLDKLGWNYLKTQRKIAKGTMV